MLHPALRRNRRKSFALRDLPAAFALVDDGVVAKNGACSAIPHEVDGLAVEVGIRSANLYDIKEERCEHRICSHVHVIIILIVTISSVAVTVSLLTSLTYALGNVADVLAAPVAGYRKVAAVGISSVVVTVSWRLLSLIDGVGDMADTLVVTVAVKVMVVAFGIFLLAGAVWGLSSLIECVSNVTGMLTAPIGNVADMLTTLVAVDMGVAAVATVKVAAVVILAVAVAAWWRLSTLIDGVVNMAGTLAMSVAVYQTVAAVGMSMIAITAWMLRSLIDDVSDMIGDLAAL